MEATGQPAQEERESVTTARFSGPVHTYTDIFVNLGFPLHFGLLSTRKHLPDENIFENGDIVTSICVRQCLFKRHDYAVGKTDGSLTLLVFESVRRH